MQTDISQSTLSYHIRKPHNNSEAFKAMMNTPVWDVVLPQVCITCVHRMNISRTHALYDAHIGIDILSHRYTLHAYIE